MNLKIKKQLPKIVLAQSLACTAILASGIYNANKVSAGDFNCNRMPKLGIEELGAEEWIHACEIWEEEPFSEKEREKIKQFFSRRAVSELLRLMQTFHAQRYVLIYEEPIRLIEEDLDKLSKLRSPVRYIDLGLIQWVANLDDNTLESLISRYKDEISRVERTKASHNAAVEKSLKLIQTVRDRGYFLDYDTKDRLMFLWLDGKTDIYTLDGLKKHLSKFPDALLEELILVYEDEISRAERGEEVKSGKCGKDAYWKLTKDGKLSVWGSGEISEFDYWIFQTDINTVDIQEGITDISNKAFPSWFNPKKLSLPKTVKIIKNGTFGNVPYVTMYRSTVCHKDAFVGSRDLIEKMEIEYKEDIRYSFDKGTLTIDAHDPMADYLNESEVPWHKYRQGIVKIVIKGDCTNIGNYAFKDCKKLEYIDLNGVTRIGSHAFENCTALKRIVLPDTLVSLGPGALKGVDLDAIVTNKKDGTYWYFPDMESIEKMGPALREGIRKSDKNFVVIDFPVGAKSVKKIVRKILIESYRNQFEYSDFEFNIKRKVLFNSRFIFTLHDKVSQQNNIDLNREISKIIQRLKIHTLKSDYEKIQTIYEYVRENVIYDKREGRYAFTAYGAAVEGKAVCSGVANFVLMLCREAGIPARKIVISAKGLGSKHAANIVKLGGNWGGKWYVLDATLTVSGGGILGVKSYLIPLRCDDAEIRVVGDIDFKDTDDYMPFLRLDDPEAVGRYPVSQYTYDTIG